MQKPGGALAFEFGDGRDGAAASGRLGLCPPRRPGLVRGPAKYRILEHRRRQAQITARRVLDLIDLAETRTSAR
jgi:hypothetical protein